MLKIAGSYKLDEQFQRLDGVTVIHSMSNNVGRHFYYDAHFNFDSSWLSN